MTNVPQPIRDAWADVYTLFDVSYKMDGSEEAWQKYWDKANELIQKYDDIVPLIDIFEAVGKMLATLIENRTVRPQKDNKSLPWKADEDYPYPKV